MDMDRKISGSRIEYDVSVHENIRIPMRDGITLAADLYSPLHFDGTPLSAGMPTILNRTPYNRKRALCYQNGRYFASRGYNWLSVDCRGRYDSDGEFHLYNQHHEGLDGFDTVEWAAAQTWSNGKIGTTGLSFEGASQQATAVMQPPHLTTQIILDAGINYWRRTLRNNGAFAAGIYAPYAVRMAIQGKEAAADPYVKKCLEDFLKDVKNWIREMPLRPGSTPLALAPSYEKWYFELAHQSDFTALYDNPTAALENYIDQYPDIPLFMMASWYGNRHAWGNFEKYRYFVEKNSSPVKLIVGHYLHQHDFMEQSFTGGVDFGLDSLRNLNDYRLRWFDEFLKGYDTAILDEPPILIRTLGGGSGRKNEELRMDHGGAWCGLNEWPPKEAQLTRLHLRADGQLSGLPPDVGEGFLRYQFDPKNPVPTIGGAIQNPRYVNDLFHGGGFDQRGQPGFSLMREGRRLSSRPDVLVFRSDELKSPMEITGEINVELWVRSSAVDTDFTVKLVDEYPPNIDYPEGFELNLVDDIVRMSYRDGRLKRELIEPGEIYKIVIGPLLISNRFDTGHRIRVDISSSSYPQFDANPNTGEEFDRVRSSIVAQNDVFTDATYPSSVSLPVVTIPR